MLFAATEQLSTSIQNENCCVKDAIQGSHMVQAFLNRQRQEELFDLFYRAAEAKSNNIR